MRVAFGGANGDQVQYIARPFTSLLHFISPAKSVLSSASFQTLPRVLLSRTDFLGRLSQLSLASVIVIDETGLSLTDSSSQEFSLSSLTPSEEPSPSLPVS